MSVSEFFHMGGYALYVWSSYGLTTVVMIALYLFAKRDQQQIKQQIARRVARSGSET
ncbi:MAG: heme exporter protein CcmD [Gammaproteobacteria bacterium]|nr:heme exporter protein CcmD [Gammaproteobacteria bacterium]MDQ7075072.1 heme exporter protein CcmD [Gammaproteobacteria bacterium]